MVIDNTNKRARKLSEKVFWYKAKLHKKVKMCDEIFWQAPKRNQDENHYKDTYNSSNKRSVHVRRWKMDQKDESYDYDPDVSRWM